MSDFVTDRRDLLLAPLLASFASVGFNPAQAAGVDPSITIITPPDQIPWKVHDGRPRNISEEAPLFSSIGAEGPYFTLIRWHPGYMSAPHFYETDRLCIVLSGTWYVASGEDFVPEKTVPVKAGSFVRRVARSIHYDGVPGGAPEPAVIAITGIGPISIHLTDPRKPGWRHV